MGAFLLSDSERVAQRLRSATNNRRVHPLFKLLAALSAAILFLALVVWTGDRNKNSGPPTSHLGGGDATAGADMPATLSRE